MDVSKLLNMTLWNPLDPVEHASRVPMKIWTEMSARNKLMLELSVNPTNVRFVQTKRVTSSVVKDGRVYYFWSSAPGEHSLDVLRLDVTGISGSILNRVAYKNYRQKVGEESVVKNAPEGALNTKHKKWLKFYGMTREAAYPAELDGEFNYAYFEYISPLFPPGKSIIFKGHFENPLQFDEDATRPFFTQYSFTFIVHSSNPDLDTLLEQVENVLVTTDRVG